MMRFWVYDDEGKLFRKFYERQEAEKFLQPKWKLVTKPKEKKEPPKPPTTEEYGEALW